MSTLYSLGVRMRALVIFRNLLNDAVLSNLALLLKSDGPVESLSEFSFAKDDDNFAALKAILEGSISSKTDNVAVYATSRRRHLVKESFSDRDGDEIHIGDTIAELTSL